MSLGGLEATAGRRESKRSRFWSRRLTRSCSLAPMPGSESRSCRWRRLVWAAADHNLARRASTRTSDSRVPRTRAFDRPPVVRVRWAHLLWLAGGRARPRRSAVGRWLGRSAHAVLRGGGRTARPLAGALQRRWRSPCAGGCSGSPPGRQDARHRRGLVKCLAPGPDQAMSDGTAAAVWHAGRVVLARERRRGSWESDAARSGGSFGEHRGTRGTAGFGGKGT